MSSSKVDVETFIKKWSSQENLNYRHSIREWMQSSYDDPLPFWEDLFTYSFHGENTSVLFEKYNFYADCILRNAGKSLNALKVIHPQGKEESWTYQAIHSLVEAQAAYWVENHGVKAGQTVVLLMAYGIHFIVALMTALRLGLVISILPLQDRFYSQQNLYSALHEIDPSLIVLQDDQKISEEWNQIIVDLTLEKTAFAPPESHAYAPGDVVQKIFNPYAEEKITTIEATRSYLVPLRDGVIALQLKPSSTWAKPLTSSYLEEPSTTLMAFLTGATIVHVPTNSLLENPELLKDEIIDVLGVSPYLHQFWIKTPGAPAKHLKLWYRSPLFGNDQSWRAFNELNELQKVPGAQLLLNREKGGMVLFSQPCSIEKVSFMHPSLGSPWKLLKLGQKGNIATEGFGLFQVEPAQVKPYLILSQVGDEWMVSASQVPLKEGYPYPTEAIEESVKGLEFVRTCMLILERNPQHYIQQHYVLLIFVAPSEYHTLHQKVDPWNQTIKELIQVQLGPVFVPDRIHFYAIYPNFEKGDPHRNWIENQYRDGALFVKQKRLVYYSLNRLRQSIYETMAYHAAD